MEGGGVETSILFEPSSKFRTMQAVKSLAMS